MDPAIMVVAIIAIVTFGRVAKAKMDRHSGQVDAATILASPEVQRMQDDLKALKDRVAVLERLATDSSSALEREIEKLRA